MVDQDRFLHSSALAIPYLWKHSCCRIFMLPRCAPLPSSYHAWHEARLVALACGPNSSPLDPTGRPSLPALSLPSPSTTFSSRFWWVVAQFYLFMPFVLGIVALLVAAIAASISCCDFVERPIAVTTNVVGNAPVLQVGNKTAVTPFGNLFSVSAVLTARQMRNGVTIPQDILPFTS